MNVGYTVLSTWKKKKLLVKPQVILTLPTAHWRSFWKRVYVHVFPSDIFFFQISLSINFQLFWSFIIYICVLDPVAVASL